MIFAVGTPGQKLRMYFECKSLTDAEAIVTDGEVLVPLEEQGSFTDLISPDGKSLVPYVKTEAELKHETEAVFNEKRRLAYPSIEDQLDTLYHEGIEAWRAVISEVKLQNPKPKD